MLSFVLVPLSLFFSLRPLLYLQTPDYHVFAPRTYPLPSGKKAFSFPFLSQHPSPAPLFIPPPPPNFGVSPLLVIKASTSLHCRSLSLSFHLLPRLGSLHLVRIFTSSNQIFPLPPNQPSFSPNTPPPFYQSSPSILYSPLK